MPLWIAYNGVVKKYVTSMCNKQKGISSEEKNSKETQATQAKNSIPAS